jgi:hypothetical protein
MTTLVADQLITELVQPLSIYRDMSLVGIRAKLYFHNSPSGTFYFNFYKNGDLFKSVMFTSAWSKLQIGTLDQSFWIDMAIQEPINLSQGDIVVKLESSGYLFTSSAWLGWCKDFNQVSGNVIGTPIDFTEHPFILRLIEYTEREF